MSGSDSTEAAAYAFAVGAFVAALALQFWKPTPILVTSTCVAALALALLLATSWRGVWNAQELWVVGALFAFLMLIVAAAVGAMLARFIRRAL